MAQRPIESGFCFLPRLGHWPSDVEGGREAADRGGQSRRRAEQACEPRNVAPQLCCGGP
ncbi:hypothetical protein SGRA_p0024 (plasmid) [Saprospira grandis str. Lewin]|uniref:Uncharacterized protein n=1 Tax=Saprospira grandis (strain Lewin) TaxID=984262 RepID=H6LAZ9_SAPGL|nr:hypothetical protein SGRA_p0024 [Saprospira grandis str. Lewin]